MRYVDDCFAFVQNKDQAMILRQHLNSQNENIKFEIELPSENDNRLSLSLLDFSVTMYTSNEPIFEFYRKPAKKNLFIHYRSHFPQTAKLNYIRNERQRISERCSNAEIHKQHENNFNKTLQLNGYPDSMIKKTNNKRRKRSKANFDGIYFPFPYVSEKVDNQIKNVFHRENINVRITKKAKLCAVH